ncbi:MAG: HNH endonuclease [Dehalococcoidia bacterium]|nr:HNH endonuclease [Dehalococcoidia bacterium]
MPELTPTEREAIIRRRGCRSDKDGRKHHISNLEIHHKDRDPNSNDPQNLRVLTKEEHRELHRRAKR